MRKNSSLDLSLFILIAKIGKTRGLKGEFFLRSFAENPDNLFSFKKFYVLTSSLMKEVNFEYIRNNNSKLVAKIQSVDDIDSIKLYGQKDIYVLKSELPENIVVAEKFFLTTVLLSISNPPFIFLDISFLYKY